MNHGLHVCHRQDSKAPEPWHFCGASSGAGGKRAGFGGAGGVSPKSLDYYYVALFNTPYHRRWRVFATHTREKALRSVPCTTCAILDTFVVLAS